LKKTEKKILFLALTQYFKKKLEQPLQNIVEFRLPVNKQPEMPHLSDEEKQALNQFSSGQNVKSPEEIMQDLFDEWNFLKYGDHQTVIWVCLN
jgi:hypothetical protein